MPGKKIVRSVVCDLRIASPKMLPLTDLLPHQECYPNRLFWGQEHEETEHVSTRRIA